MSRNRKKNKCQCGGSAFENVDITSAGSPQKRYFTRCRKCGLVVRSYQSDRIPAVLQALKRVCEKIKIKRNT